MNSIHVDDILPTSWRDLFSPGDPVGIGVDLGTTTEKKSNPTAIAVTQHVGSDFLVRLLIRYKTANDLVTEKLIKKVHDLPHGLRARQTCIDATNERFFATRLRRKLMGTAIVILVISSEGTTYMGESMNMKTYLGNLLVNTIEDGHLGIPEEAWLEKDVRQVQRDRGMFNAKVDEEGNHADCFDAIKNSLYALTGKASGPVEAHAAQVGTFMSGSGMKTGIRGRENQAKNLY